MRVLPPRTYAADPHFDKVLPFGVSHPAKMAPSLCRDLFLRYTREGQTVLDPFGGRGTSLVGITLGRDVILNELEPPFVEHIRANYAHLKAHTLPGVPLGEATILQGDSRKLPLPSAVEACVSSPPYADSHLNDQQRVMQAGYGPENPSWKAAKGEQGYDGRDNRQHTNAANIGNLPHGDVDAAVTSPPFGSMNAADAGGNVVQRPAADGNGWAGGREAFVYSEGTPGQIGNLSHDHAGVDHACVSSPPFGGSEAVDGRQHNNATNLGHGGGNGARQHYQERDNIARLTHAPSAAITSPPYVDARQGWPKPEGAENIRYGDSPEQIGGLAHGDVDAAISSPPYGDVCDRNRTEEGYAKAHPERAAEYGSTSPSRHVDGYGQSEGQIGSLPHRASDGRIDDAAVTSPPYDGLAQTGGGIFTRDASIASSNMHEYGATEGQIGNDRGETYSTAVLAVYRECFRVVRPGGVLVLVTGNYVRDGQVIDLAEDTIKLAVAAGWTPVERWRHEKAQVSFWRRLHHRQGRPVVSHEDVLVFSKGQPGWEFAELPPTTKAPADLSEARALVGLSETGALPLPLPLEGLTA